MFFSWDGDNLILDVRVQTRSTEDKFTNVINNRIKLRITAPPVDGKANSHIISFLSKTFKVHPSRGYRGQNLISRYCRVPQTKTNA
jgi:uncharacterized protein (TIGR00251 family)